MDVIESGFPACCAVCDAKFRLDMDRVRSFVAAQGAYISRCPECGTFIHLTAEALKAVDDRIATKAS